MILTSWTRESRRFDPILVLSSERGLAVILADMLRGYGPLGAILWAGSVKEGLAIAHRLRPRLCFVEETGKDLDGLSFVRQLRESDTLAKAAPVILISREATVVALRAAQNAGVHEFLLRPFSASQLLKRLDAITGPPRAWVATDGYHGPDRRRFNAAETQKTPLERRRGRWTPKPID